jgi:hypothetical protein
LADDFADDDDDAGAGGGGFWMPDIAIGTPQRSSPQARSPLVPNSQGPNEFWDGYHLWQEWPSRKAGKPFWHCKETGELVQEQTVQLIRVALTTGARERERTTDSQLKVDTCVPVFRRTTSQTEDLGNQVVPCRPRPQNLYAY